MPIRILVNINVAGFDRWWEAAVAAGDSAPEPLKRLLAGADVIEVTDEEAQQIRRVGGQDSWMEGSTR